VSHGLVVETKVATWSAERCTDIGTEGGFAQLEEVNQKWGRAQPLVTDRCNAKCNHRQGKGRVRHDIEE